MVSVRYDAEIKALYFQMTKDKVAETVSLRKDQFLDINKMIKSYAWKCCYLTKFQ